MAKMTLGDLGGAQRDLDQAIRVKPSAEAYINRGYFMHQSGDHHAAMADYCQQQDLNMGKLGNPLRIAVVGGPVSPELGHTLDLLGKERALNRIARFLEAVQAFAAAQA